MSLTMNTIPILQIAVSPVILISGVGLLLLTLTNRFGRLLDRARALHKELTQTTMDSTREALSKQIDILKQRSRILRIFIMFGAATIIGVALLILFLYLFELFEIEHTGFISTVFVLSIICILVSMVAFIVDMHFSLNALDLDLHIQ